MTRNRIFLACLTFRLAQGIGLADDQGTRPLVKPAERAVGESADRGSAGGDEFQRRLLQLLHRGADPDGRSREQSAGVDLVRFRLLRMQSLRWEEDAKRGIVEPVSRQDPAPREEGAAPREPMIPVEDSFEDWAFDGMAGAAKFRQQLEKLLDRKLAEVKQVFHLSEAQERKLRLAGKGDVQRVLDLIEQTRREFERSRSNPDRLVELRRNLRLIELRVSDGLFEMDSLLTKTLRKLYDGKQLVRRTSGPK
ncbi:MAG: hypothetical protein U0790_13575 [Isosphaeraceae bacterium]